VSAAVPHARLRKPLVGVWLLLWPAVLAILLFPIRFGGLRLALVLALFVLWAGALWLFRERRWVRRACLGLAALAGAIVLLPGSTDDPGALRRAYVRALGSYEGVRYVWGGETRLGIDCSGLPRRALIDAHLNRGIRTANPRLLRRALDLWWHDSSARALQHGYRGQTRFLLAARGLNALDHARLLPGDIAVTANGLHALVYVGSRTWIEADPGPAGRVLKVTVPAADNVWFDTPVDILRWRDLEGRGA
jgi:hypothetical protein